MANEPVRIATVAAASGFLIQAAFQAGLALGAPLGSASWGGAYEGQLPVALRIASGVAVGVYVLAALIVVRRAGFRGVPLTQGFLRWGTWVLVVLMFLGALENFASSSGWERYGWGPFTLILALLCLFVALRAGPVSRES
jgi:Ca2+/H+ antiporter